MVMRNIFFTTCIMTGVRHLDTEGSILFIAHLNMKLNINQPISLDVGLPKCNSRNTT